MAAVPAATMPFDPSAWSAALSPFIKSLYDGSKGTCQQGERADLTGCTPVGEEAAATKKPKVEAKPKKPSLLEVRKAKDKAKLAATKQMILEIAERVESLKESYPAPPLTEVAKRTQELVAAAVQSNGKLTAMQKENYTKASEEVCARMPERAHERIARHLKKTVIHAGHDGVTEAIWRNVEEQVDFAKYGEAGEIQRKIERLKYEKNKAAGVFILSKGELNLDGPAPLGQVGMGRLVQGLTSAHVYAHEFGHVIDGPDLELSNSEDWKAAYAEEIVAEGKETPLTSYAKKSSSEGLAEFARVLYGGGFRQEQVKKLFPKCCQFFVERGLWPNS